MHGVSVSYASLSTGQFRAGRADVSNRGTHFSSCLRRQHALQRHSAPPRCHARPHRHVTHTDPGPRSCGALGGATLHTLGAPAPPVGLAPPHTLGAAAPPVGRACPAAHSRSPSLRTDPPRPPGGPTGAVLPRLGTVTPRSDPRGGIHEPCSRATPAPWDRPRCGSVYAPTGHTVLACAAAGPRVTLVSNV